ncbi:hypothetical protein SAMN04488118_10592 [Epibacterium ulvae]|uniref:Uncharacterized protein n=1 Tax=Epibacterium ulvae TaxID=1156985 RepID=A0A1G5QPE5_9RHOB|nr:hypothetical protein [Epibacterium ulvae]SCZ63607.1 hypothetical protein SAMN04488118_10592 [Epibacterium ulvae]
MALARTTALIATLAVTLVAACDKLNEGKRTRYDGVPFAVKTKALDKKRNRALFEVTVRDANRSLKGARLAAIHEGTRYCIENYGNSDINWQDDPQEEEAALRLSGSSALFQGTCDS